MDFLISPKTTQAGIWRHVVCLVLFLKEGPITLLMKRRSLPFKMNNLSSLLDGSIHILPKVVLCHQLICIHNIHIR
ncbi:hypothetical protein M8C21_023820 [Ambrosia artemisiifolia]|uniref:Uncharacterized protein n=1 Tax=Ambrosia artemisiifolia TaxID=4212 RepID=A0AAD5BUV6_AMBAR|nr:hypothetical protein M8C21_023820 [Ambrosia artemisiifolia]